MTTKTPSLVDAPPYRMHDLAFCRSLRDALAQRCSLDLSVPPCVPTARSRVKQQDRHVLHRGVSRRKRALDTAELKKALPASMLAHIRAHSRLWQEVVSLRVLHRATVVKELLAIALPLRKVTS